MQCAGLFYVCKGLGGGTRSRYYTSEYHKFSYVHISIVEAVSVLLWGKK